MKLLTRDEIIKLINDILDVEHHTEKELDDLLHELENGVIDPYISNYIYWEDLTPEEIADKALAYEPIYL